MVVQVAARTFAVVAGVHERYRRIDEAAPDRGHVGHGVEQGVGRGRRCLIDPGSRGFGGKIPPVGVGEPRQRGHVELIGGRGGRGVQEAFAVVVQNVLAVVGAVEQRRGGLPQSAQEGDRFGEK